MSDCGGNCVSGAGDCDATGGPGGEGSDFGGGALWRCKEEEGEEMEGLGGHKYLVCTVLVRLEE